MWIQKPGLTESRFFKTAARCLLQRGGLSLLRSRHRREFRILMFHRFARSNRCHVETICSHLARHFEPLSLSQIATALQRGAALPANAITVTVDDGYRNFLEHGHSIFRKHRIPTTVYVVSGFVDGRCWLWSDQVAFALEHTPKRFLEARVNGTTYQLQLTSAQQRIAAADTLLEALKIIPNDMRIRFISSLGALCEMDVPSQPPAHLEAMTWDDLRAAAAEGVEIGCHSESHPILSQITNPRELEREIRGAKVLIEKQLRREVRHFAYPNGRDIDISEAAVDAVRHAGFVTAATTSAGLNTKSSDHLRLRRLPLSDDTPLHYAAETLVGLHL